MIALNCRIAEFRDPSLNRSQEIPPEADGCGIFDCFFPSTSDQKSVVCTISGMAVDSVGMEVRSV